MNPQRVTVWSSLWAGGLIGPYFLFENDSGQAVTVKSVRHREMITNSLCPKEDDMWFQRDDATYGPNWMICMWMGYIFVYTCISRQTDIARIT